MRFACLALIALAACHQAESGSSGSARVALTAPAWTAAAQPLERRGTLTLFAGTAERAPDQTDLRPARPLAVHDDAADTWLLPPEPAWAGALANGAVLWVTTRGDLVLDDGLAVRTLASAVVPEIDVDPGGALVAFTRGPGDEAGVYLASLAPDATPPRRVTPGLATADRPLFADDTTLIVAGARPGGVTGLWTLRYREVDVRLQPLTNAALRVGTPLGPSFVPPPAYHASMRIEDGALVYHDGAGERRVALGGQP